MKIRRKMVVNQEGYILNPLHFTDPNADMLRRVTIRGVLRAHYQIDSYDDRMVRIPKGHVMTIQEGEDLLWIKKHKAKIVQAVIDAHPSQLRKIATTLGLKL